MSLSPEEGKQMQFKDIMDLKREELADAEKININVKEPMKERVKAYIEQTGNPYAWNVGEYILQIGYMEGATDTIHDCMLLLAERKQDERESIL